MTNKKTAYKRQYNNEHYSRIGLYLLPEEKERWQAAADLAGVPLSTYVKNIINRELAE